MFDIDYAADKILSQIKSKASIIAIDGRCASGKTTLAARLREKSGCAVVHCDDFFLPPNMRSEARLCTAGGNFHRERFFSEVLLPLSQGCEAHFRPFLCKTSSFGETVSIAPNRLVVAEGSYCCHPFLWDFYALRVFLSVDSKTQAERINRRNPQNAQTFFNKWIPLEEEYFSQLKIKENCDLVFE